MNNSGFITKYDYGLSTNSSGFITSYQLPLNTNLAYYNNTITWTLAQIFNIDIQVEGRNITAELDEINDTGYLKNNSDAILSDLNISGGNFIVRNNTDGKSFFIVNSTTGDVGVFGNIPSPHPQYGSNRIFNIDRGVLQLSSGMVNAITDEMPATAYAKFGEYGTDSGGFFAAGIGEGASDPGMYFVGIIGNSNPTDTVPAVNFIAGKQWSTTYNKLGQLETTFQFLNKAIPQLTMLGSGYVGINTTTPSYTLDVNGEISAASDLYSEGRNITAELDYAIPINITASGNITASLLAGTGNAYACIDANGQIYRSSAVCT